MIIVACMYHMYMDLITAFAIAQAAPNSPRHSSSVCSNCCVSSLGVGTKKVGPETINGSSGDLMMVLWDWMVMGFHGEIMVHNGESLITIDRFFLNLLVIFS